jgi:hypothetical protein
MTMIGGGDNMTEPEEAVEVEAAEVEAEDDETEADAGDTDDFEPNEKG